jgi:hypothetical protein
MTTQPTTIEITKWLNANRDVVRRAIHPIDSLADAAEMAAGMWSLDHETLVMDPLIMQIAMTEAGFGRAKPKLKGGTEL